MNKTLITSIVYFKPELVKTHVDFLTTVNDKADIIILENPSHATPEISNHCIDLVNNGKIDKYLLFDDNIGMNTFETLFNSPDIVDLNDYSYVLVTDGDLTVKDPNWLDEQIFILDKYPDTYACGVTMSLENLPSADLFPDAKHWYPPSFEVADDYEVGATGLHLLMYKREMLVKFINHIRENSLNFMDVVMHKFARENYKDFKWRRTRKARSYHLTWDVYQNINDDYTQIKLTKTQEEMWYHKRNCNFRVFEKDSSYTHSPYVKV